MRKAARVWGVSKSTAAGRINAGPIQYGPVQLDSFACVNCSPATGVVDSGMSVCKSL